MESKSIVATCMEKFKGINRNKEQLPVDVYILRIKRKLFKVLKS